MCQSLYQGASGLISWRVASGTMFYKPVQGMTSRIRELYFLNHTQTRKPVAIFKGRLSFPSGHSSTAFSGMTFISLWLAGRSAAWCFNIPMPANSLRSSRIGNFCLTLLPLIWATFVAITRMQDYVRNNLRCSILTLQSEFI